MSAAPRRQRRTLAREQRCGRARPVQETLEDVSAARSDLVALEPVKARMREIAALLVIDRLPGARARVHATFSAHVLHRQPGDGQDHGRAADGRHPASARLYREAKLVSVSRDDLVGQYVGHTAPKTREVLKRAYGGVLFIDEAYYLDRPENERDYGQEAIEVLLHAMEADRDGSS